MTSTEIAHGYFITDTSVICCDPLSTRAANRDIRSRFLADGFDCAQLAMKFLFLLTGGAKKPQVLFFFCGCTRGGRAALPEAHCSQGGSSSSPLCTAGRSQTYTRAQKKEVLVKGVSYQHTEQ